MAENTLTEGVADEILREFSFLSGNRGTWEAHWEEIAQRVFPAYAGAFTGSASSTINTPNAGFSGGSGGQAPGAKRTFALYDSTAPIALTRFAAAMESMLTPRSSKWHRIVAGNPALQRDRSMRLWLDEVNTLLFKYRYAPTANFQSQIHQNYMALGSFGTGAVFIDEHDSDPGLRYRAIHLGEIYFSENHQGVVDKALRKFSHTARQAIQRWGKEALPEEVVKAVESNPEREFYFIHCVKPRSDYDPTRRDKKGMRWVSHYVSITGKKVLSEGGYTTFPYAISRYVQAPGELYGRSPAMDALPAIKTLNEQKKTVLKQGHRAVDPVLLAHDDGVLDSFSMKSGAINYGGVNAAGQALVHTLPVGNIAIAKDLMDLERATINDAFLVTLFQILTETPQMTATEVLERVREKGAMLSPTMGRQQSEMLGPMIERELDLLSRQGLLPPMPPSLREAGGEFNIEYDSPLSRAQKAEEASGLMRTVEFAINVATNAQDPEVLDHFDWDTIVPAMADIQAVPPRWLRAQDDIVARRKGRADAAQSQQMIDAAPAAASVMKTMGQSA